MSQPPFIVIILNGRGQLIYRRDDPSRTPVPMPAFDNINYASCANYGVCAYQQPDEIGFRDELVQFYRRGEPMNDDFLRKLGGKYEEFYEGAEDYTEFTYQQENYWTRKPMKYDKYIRCYPPTNAFSKFPPEFFQIISFTVMDGQCIPVPIPDYSRTTKVLLSTFLDDVRRMYPATPLEIYDTRCLKLLSDEDVGPEPNQYSRTPPGVDENAFIIEEIKKLNSASGGRLKRRRTKNRTRRNKNKNKK